MIAFLRAFSEHVSARWRTNSRGYFTAFAPYLAVVFLAAAADFWSTYRVLLVEGAESELHPVIRLSVLCWGRSWAPSLER